MAWLFRCIDQRGQGKLPRTKKRFSVSTQGDKRNSQGQKNDAAYRPKGTSEASKKSKQLDTTNSYYSIMQFKSILVAALAAVSLSAAAQDAPKEKFHPHWTLGLQGGAGYSYGEHKKFSDVITPAAGVHLGYQFTPVFNLRGHVSGWQGKNGWSVDHNPQYYKWNYVNAGLDGVFNLSNLFAGYNPNRCVSFSAFLGAGYIHGFDNKQALDVHNSNNTEVLRAWNSNTLNVPAGRVGAIVDFRLCKRVSFNVEALVTATHDKFNSKDGYGKNVDWQSNLFGGFTFRLGKLSTVVPVPVVPAPVAPAPEPVEEPAPAPCPVVGKDYKPEPVKVEPLTRNVFFLINSAKVRPSELVKVQEVVAYLNANPNAKVAITGYADKGTGNKTINARLSKQRANAVFNELVKKNIPANRIVKDAKGDTVQPFSVNNENRVVICIAE